MKYALQILVSVIFGYFMGCFSLSSLLAQKRGFDIRTRGTNSAGASNAAVTMGWKAGVLVAICDIMKGFVAVLAVRLVSEHFGFMAILPYVTGVSCVLGHMHPFHLKFRGGKGFATYLGMILVIDWKFCLILATGIIAVALISDYIVMGTMLTMISFPILVFFFKDNIPAGILVTLLSLLIIYRHKKNLIDIIHGRERKVSGVFKKKK